MMTKPIKEFRLAGQICGRVGMAEMAKGFISECDGSYKGIMELCGRLSVVAKMATCDDYWNEQVSRGIEKAEFKIELINEQAIN
jgi:hypothetical protein